MFMICVTIFCCTFAIVIQLGQILTVLEEMLNKSIDQEKKERK